MAASVFRLLQPQPPHKFLGGHYRSCQPSRVLCGEVDGGLGHVFRRGPGGEVGVGALEAESLGGHRAQGLEGVHRDVVRPQFGGQSPGQPLQRRLRRSVSLPDDGNARIMVFPQRGRKNVGGGMGRDVDDAPAALLDHDGARPPGRR